MKAKTIFILLISFFISNSFAQDDEKARAIVKKAHEITLGATSKSTMTMEIVRPEWSRTVSMQSWSMGVDYYIIYIMSPARDKGQVFLKRRTICGTGFPVLGV